MNLKGRMAVPRPGPELHEPVSGPFFGAAFEAPAVTAAWLIIPGAVQESAFLKITASGLLVKYN